MAFVKLGEAAAHVSRSYATASQISSGAMPWHYETGSLTATSMSISRLYTPRLLSVSLSGLVRKFVGFVAGRRGGEVAGGLVPGPGALS